MTYNIFFYLKEYVNYFISPLAPPSFLKLQNNVEPRLQVTARTIYATKTPKMQFFTQDPADESVFGLLKS